MKAVLLLWALIASAFAIERHLAARDAQAQYDDAAMALDMCRQSLANANERAADWLAKLNEMKRQKP